MAETKPGTPLVRARIGNPGEDGRRQPAPCLSHRPRSEELPISHLDDSARRSGRTCLDGSSDRHDEEPYDARVLIFLVLGYTPWLLLLTLAVLLYLTVIELRVMDVHYTRWVWWLLLVFMTHFVGYLFLRAYALYRRRQFAQP
jgi:hypothetical protein